jgi:hypothetical protein
MKQYKELKKARSSSTPSLVSVTFFAAVVLGKDTGKSDAEKSESEEDNENKKKEKD